MEALLRHYQALLVKWQEKINLVSPTTIQDSWKRHFEDSLQLLPLVPEGAKTLYDLGCGAGFPGLVLAMARPDLAVTLVESDAKKCAFLTAVSRETGVQVTIQNSRIEAATATLPPPDIITARALASLEKLFDLAHPWLASNPVLIFPKGKTGRPKSLLQRPPDGCLIWWKYRVIQTKRPEFWCLKTSGKLLYKPVCFTWNTELS
jgi:16S rRNA (guanine527-N7)-methyltransferase